MDHFYLIQRLQQSTPRIEAASPVGEAMLDLVNNGMGAVRSTDSDVDPVLRAGLGFDYMGASEFEHGAIARSANRIISDMSRLAVVTSILIRPSYIEPVHFVCSEEHAEIVLPYWHKWSQNPYSHEEPHYFKDSDKDIVREGDKTVAWWALNEELIWTRDPALAEKIREGFTERKYDIFAQKSLFKRVKAKITGNAPR